MAETNSTEGGRSKSPSEIAAAAAHAVHNQRVEAEADYAALIVRKTLDADEARRLHNAITELKLSPGKVASDIQAVRRARQLRQTIRESSSEATARSLEESRLAVAEHDHEVAQYLRAMEKKRDGLAEAQHRWESLAHAFDSAGKELHHLENQFPFLRGMAAQEVAES